MKTLTKFMYIRETSKAILVIINGKSVWVPKSIIVNCNIDMEKKVGDAYIPDWFLNKHV